MINILIEGEGSEKEFWEKILLRYHSNLIKLMSYNGIDSLASFFDKVYSPESDLFVISVDNVVDNPSVYEIIGEFKNDLVDKKNVIVLDLICFEDTLLNFKLLEKWMFSEEARAANKNTQERLSLLNGYRELGFKWATSAELFSFVQKWYGHIGGISTENVASAVLNKVTSGTNFKTNKSTLGHCFTVIVQAVLVLPMLTYQCNIIVAWCRKIIVEIYLQLRKVKRRLQICITIQKCTMLF